MKRFSILILFAAFILLSSGCFSLRGLKPDLVVKHPDSPMMIIEGKGKIKVAIYDPSKNELIEYGWVDLNLKCNHYHGWTLMKYDWQKFIKKRDNE